MLHTFVLTSGIFILAATLGTAAIFIVPNGHGENWVEIYQNSPLGGDATIEVKQRDGVTIIERHDAAGNNATIIQQR